MRILLLLLICLFVTSCYTEIVYGTKEIRDEKNLVKIVEQESTQNDVLKLIGEPKKIEFVDKKMEVWIYEFIKVYTEYDVFVPQEKIKTEMLNLLFDENKLLVKKRKATFTKIAEQVKKCRCNKFSFQESDSDSEDVHKFHLKLHNDAHQNAIDIHNKHLELHNKN